MYQKALREDPHDVTAYYALDDLYEKVGDLYNRRDLLERALEEFPEDDAVAIRTARYWAWQRQYAKAALILEGHSFHRRHQSWRMMAMAERTVEEVYTGLAMEAARKDLKKEADDFLMKAASAREQVRRWFD